MNAHHPRTPLETVTVPRAELETHTALTSLMDRTLGILMKKAPRDGTDLLDLDRAYHHARAVIQAERDSRPARTPAVTIGRPYRPRRARIGGIAP
ncbi:hypothetical protein HLH33_13070 [Gluconacetobacter diazotrophicus]|uniref:Uncharacterized protein n=1 Tax=Gluconacetobacter diazotrophicus TaxID=33996 RepID=A0A7W4I6L6_GLUDI|nr:hypothetical protein [Gluconacetobacter diazotrophicus]MBB2157231.1 hypothetical protein [Gluconacetobacter diazotrophicus]